MRGLKPPPPSGSSFSAARKAPIFIDLLRYAAHELGSPSRALSKPIYAFANMRTSLKAKARIFIDLLRHATHKVGSPSRVLSDHIHATFLNCGERATGSVDGAVMNSEIQIAASDFGVAKKSPPKELFASEALALISQVHKLKTGTSSRHWRSVVRGYWRSL